MDASKDYYAVLGVLPSIEPTALKAVYLALVKKYHPDVYKGSKADAERITKELNQAYGVLGDQAKRAEYDALRKNQTSQGGDFGQEASGDDTETQDNDLERDWKFVVQYHPEAETQRLHLQKIASSLALMFQILVITQKLAREPAKSKKLATALQFEYMSRYFGKKLKLHDFVIQLLLAKRKDAALEINNYVRLMGDIPDKDLNYFIHNFKIKFNIKNVENKQYNYNNFKMKRHYYIILSLIFAIVFSFFIDFIFYILDYLFK